MPHRNVVKVRRKLNRALAENERLKKELERFKTPAETIIRIGRVMHTSEVMSVCVMFRPDHILMRGLQESAAFYLGRQAEREADKIKHEIVKGILQHAREQGYVT